MESIRTKLGIWSKDRALVRTLAILIAALLLLGVLFCISIHMRTNIQKRYSNALNQMQEETYRHLSALSESFKQLQEAEAQDQLTYFPEFKAQYSAVMALNTALSSGFGERHAVLKGELTGNLTNAFEQYVSAMEQNRATGLARADIAACVEVLDKMIEERYAHLEEEPVPVIDGSSGEFRKEA